jgi:hypothetical protein
MTEERIDFSALDPERNSGQWQSVVDAMLSRIDIAMDERGRASNDPLMTIAGWSREVLIAAAAALAILIPAELALDSELPSLHPGCLRIAVEVGDGLAQRCFDSARRTDRLENAALERV